MREVYVIAEAGVNHNGDRDLAFALVDAAAETGANAVKFQTFNAAKLTSRKVGKAAYQTASTGGEESQQEMLSKLELPWEWHGALKHHAEAKGMDFMSTAFDVESLALLVGLGIPMVKVPSGELTNGPLLWQYARANLPLILSTGMATLSDVEQALAVLSHAFNETEEPRSLDDVWRSWSVAERRASLAGRVTLLHCTTQYPTRADEVNLAAMDTLRAAFGLPVGYSDHTMGATASVAAVARGAVLVEKHFTMDRALPGPDHAASLEPGEFAAMVREIRAVERMIGDGMKAPQPSEWDSRRAGRQQVIAARDVAAGSVLSREDLTTARCGEGLMPAEIWGLVGTAARQDVAAGEVYPR
ncbi:N-acetylneuraminate synthase [Sphingomonas sp. R-74633]|uniref:N-acetylneuraminate synthase n=1 Tax=Sphingomonas sp. R-74633 TaxID=2751188 RepID=UPI0015D153BA|nr:N-acetylneuraminate synthase [Sphingomonas sp. R-74633]NYT39220.1 N-acetylneuraminate synthase [Sphingomonas sp. R-74633]